MDPIEILAACRRAAETGAPAYITVPRIFSPGDYQAMWRRDSKAARAHIDGLLCSPNPGDGLELLLQSGALGALFPEVVAMKNLGDDPAAALHKDVWEHTKRVVAGVPASPDLRWAALMHDIGKARTRRVQGGVVSFHNHDVVGAHMLDSIERRLGLFNDDTMLMSTVRSLVLNHLRPASYRASWSDSGVRRLISDVGGLTAFDRLMSLSRSDLTTKNASKREKALARGRELEARVRDVYAADNAPRLPKGTMGIILERSGSRPGRWLNDAREALEAMLASGELPAGEGPEFYVEAFSRMSRPTRSLENDKEEGKRCDSTGS